MSLENILNMQADEIEAPKSVPVGSYGVTVVQVQDTESSQKKTPAKKFGLKITEVRDDVDQDALAEFRSNGQEPVGMELSHTLYLTENSAFMLRDFLKDVLGIASSGRTLAAMLDEAVGKECIAKVVHRPSQDGKRVFAQVDDVLPL